MSAIEEARNHVLAKKEALKADKLAETAPVTTEQPPQTPPETPAAAPEATATTPEATTPAAETVTPEAQAETPAATTTAEEDKAWSKPLQKVQQELGNMKRDREETNKTLQTILAKLEGKAADAAPAQTATQQEVVKDKIADLREKVKLAREDPYTAPDVMEGLLDQVQELSANIKQRDAKDAEAENAAAGWRSWAAANPTVPVDKAQDLVRKCQAEAAQKGYSGEALRLRTNEMFSERVVKLAKPSSTTTPATTTVPAARVSTPAGTRVTPVNSGVRSQPRPPAQKSAKSYGDYGRNVLSKRR